MKLLYYQHHFNDILEYPVTAMDDWKINRKFIELKSKLRDEEFTAVWAGMWNGTTPIAVKIPKPGSVTISEFLAEAQIMKNLQHEKLIQLYGVCTQGEPIYIVTELMKHYSLLQYLHNDEGRYLKLPELINIGAQVANGMAYLESQYCIHRDLAARNVQVGEGNIVKIGGFSLACLIVDDCYLEKEKIPGRWTAPEAHRHTQFTIKSDVWSFGVFLTELVTHGRVPYPGMTDDEVLELVEQGYRMPRPPGCSDPLYQIMLECWKTKPEERPTLEYLKHQLEDYFISTEEEITFGVLRKLFDYCFWTCKLCVLLKLKNLAFA